MDMFDKAFSNAINTAINQQIEQQQQQLAQQLVSSMLPDNGQGQSAGFTGTDYASNTANVVNMMNTVLMMRLLQKIGL